MRKITVGIVGVGNCASSLLQGIEFYRAPDPATDGHPIGLMHYEVCGYRPSDLEVVCAFDVDASAVGHSLREAATAPPNTAPTLCAPQPRSAGLVPIPPSLREI